MSSKILVPLDGSDLAERALPFASSIARARDGRLVLLHVVSPLGWDLKPPPEHDLLGELNAVAARVRAEGVEAEPAMYNGYHTAPGIIIARAASEIASPTPSIWLASSPARRRPVGGTCTPARAEFGTIT